ncbi:hypothetical protein AB0M43_35595 [Longispora sp. NPDC051575]|uniref:hypothetical protein n=1 Tax=Longispora sp. NPDC051575 TaxID=3154943 RepID=UPI003439D23F
MVPSEAERLGRYLGAVVSARQCPVHIAVAFNAVYFGYDVVAGGYVGGPLDLDVFPQVRLGDSGPALPIGAMINLVTGAGLLPAEVVYKEGARWSTDQGEEIPEDIVGESAAPADAHVATLRERLVIDFDAFGRGLSASTTQIARLSRKARWLNPDGHLVLDSEYPSAAAADLDDLAYYARYLAGPARHLILSSLAPLPLATLLAPGAGAIALEQALTSVFATVREALLWNGEIRMHGDYAVSRASYASRLHDDGVLGGGDLDSLSTTIAGSAVPRPGRRGSRAARVTHTALGPAIRKLAGTGGLLRGLAYPLAICHANLLLGDFARSSSDEETGLLDNGVRLTLRDAWQAGGVWRAEYVGREALPSPDLPDPGFPPGPVVAPEDAPRAPAPWETVSWARDDESLSEPRIIEASDEEVVWTSVLRLSHLRNATLLLPDPVAAGLAPTPNALRVELDHDGGLTTSVATVVRAAGRPYLAGSVWPSSFFPGIVLILRWTPGTDVVRARTVRLDPPVRVDGETFWYRFDRRVLTRDGAAEDGDGAPTGAVHQVMRAVRVLGLLDNYGRATLPESRLFEAVRLLWHDRGARPDPELTAAVVTLLARRVLSLEWGSLAADGQVDHPARARQARIRLLSYVPVRDDSAWTQPEWSPLAAARPLAHSHVVQGHIRRIDHLGQQASDAARTAYREDKELWGLVGSREIPDGYTYVPAHRRGV